MSAAAWGKRKGVPIGYRFMPVPLALLDDPTHARKLGRDALPFLRLARHRTSSDGPVVTRDRRDDLTPDDLVAILGLDVAPDSKPDKRGRTAEHRRGDGIVRRLEGAGYVTTERTAHGRRIRVSAPWSAIAPVHLDRSTRSASPDPPTTRAGAVPIAAGECAQEIAGESPRNHGHRSDGDSVPDCESRPILQSVARPRDLEARERKENTTTPPGASPSPVRAREAVASVVVGSFSIEQPDNLESIPPRGGVAHPVSPPRGDTGQGFGQAKLNRGDWLEPTPDQEHAIAALELDGAPVPEAFRATLGNLCRGSDLAGALLAHAWAELVASWRTEYGGRSIAPYLEGRDESATKARQVFDHAAALDPRGLEAVKAERERQRKAQARRAAAWEETKVMAAIYGRYLDDAPPGTARQPGADLERVDQATRANLQRVAQEFHRQGLRADALAACVDDAARAHLEGKIRGAAGAYLRTALRNALADQQADAAEHRAAVEAHERNAGPSADPHARELVRTLTGRMGGARSPGAPEPAAPAMIPAAAQGAA